MQDPVMRNRYSGRHLVWPVIFDIVNGFLDRCRGAWSVQTLGRQMRDNRCCIWLRLCPRDLAIKLVAWAFGAHRHASGGFWE